MREGRAEGLRYLEVVIGAEPEAPLPLVVFFHGRGDRAHRGWIRDFAEPARYVFPEAPTPYGHGFSWFSYIAGEADVSKVAASIDERVTHVARFLRTLHRERPTRDKPIVLGFSQGGHLAFGLALLHPDTVGFAVPIAGDMPEPLWPAHETASPAHPKILALAGRDDRVIAFASTERTVHSLRERGFDVELLAYERTGHEITSVMWQRIRQELRAALARVQP